MYLVLDDLYLLGEKMGSCALLKQKLIQSTLCAYSRTSNRMSLL